MPDFVSKIRFFEMGKSAPKNSSFTGKINAATIFGNWDSEGKGNNKFNYDERFVNYENNKTLIDYTSRFTSDIPTFLYDKKYNKTYTNLGFLETKEISDSFRKYSYDINNHDGALIWECIISLKDIMTADKYGMYNQYDFASVMDTVLYKFFDKYGFDKDNMVFWQDYHENESKKGVVHPHIHISFFEINKTRTKGVLPEKAIDYLKNSFAIELAKRENLHEIKYDSYLSKGDEYKDSIIQLAKLNNLSKFKDVHELYKVLPDTGRLQYNSYQMKPFKKAIDKTIDSILNSQNIKPLYDNLINSFDEYDELINEKVGSNVSKHRENEIRKLYEKLGNIILKGKKSNNQDYNKHLVKKKYNSIIKEELAIINGKDKDDDLINETYNKAYDKLITNYEKLEASDLKELANFSYRGLGTNKNLDNAISFMNVAIAKLAEDDSFNFCSYNNFLSKLYTEKGDDNSAVNCLMLSANKGDNRAELRLGILQINGKGISKDKEEGLYKIVRASEKGNRNASKWLRANGFKANGSTRTYYSSNYYPANTNNYSIFHRKLLHSVEYVVEQHQKEVNRAISNYLRQGRDYENYDYNL